MSKVGIVATELYDGQGLGNQLWVYAVTRVAAQRTGQQFAILGADRFKGRSFLNLDFGVEISKGISLPGGPPLILPKGIEYHLQEQRSKVQVDGMDVSGVDLRFLSPPQNSKLDGNMQSVTYIWEELDSIREWIRPIDDINGVQDYCAIHVRLGDFTGKGGPFVGWDYYLKGIEHFRRINPDMTFRCVSDDVEKCRENLPGFIHFVEQGEEDQHKAKHHLGGPIHNDFQVLLGAKNLLISNSSFSWWSAVLNHKKEMVIAPKYWARYNIGDGLWSTSDIITPGFSYLNKSGTVQSYEECVREATSSAMSHDIQIVSLAPKTILKSVFGILWGWAVGAIVRAVKRFPDQKKKFSNN